MEVRGAKLSPKPLASESLYCERDHEPFRSFIVVDSGSPSPSNHIPLIRACAPAWAAMQSSIMSCIAANPIGKASRLGGGGARPAAAAAARRRVLLRSGGDSPAGAVEGSEQQAASAVPPPLSPSVLPLPEGLPEQEVSYVARSTGQQLWTSTKLCFALPWRRFKSKSALVLKLGGEIAEQPQVRVWWWHGG